MDAFVQLLFLVQQLFECGHSIYFPLLLLFLIICPCYMKMQYIGKIKQEKEKVMVIL